MERQSKLDAYERMHRAVKAEYEDICSKMERLKQEERTKSATYRQLAGRKLMYTNMLSLYRLYDIEE